MDPAFVYGLFFSIPAIVTLLWLTFRAPKNGNGVHLTKAAMEIVDSEREARRDAEATVELLREQMYRGADPDVMSLSDLYEFIVTRFNIEEMDTLAFLVGINKDNVPGRTIPEKARELIEVCKRRRLIGRLYTEARKARPNSDLQQT